MQPWKWEQVNSAANEGVAMMSHCLITTQSDVLGFCSVPSDIIGNWFWRLLQAVFYETWNCWTKQRISWAVAQKTLAEQEGTLLIAYQYHLAWRAVNYVLFTQMPQRNVDGRGRETTHPFGMQKHMETVTGSKHDGPMAGKLIVISNNFNISSEMIREAPHAFSIQSQKRNVRPPLSHYHRELFPF